MNTFDDWVLPVGQTVDGRYELLEQLGRGPLGLCYRAADLGLGGEVLFKLLHPALACSNNRELNLFRLYRARAMVHPNLIPVNEVLDRGDVFAAVSPLIHAHTLRVFLNARRHELRPLTRPELATLSVQLCRALQRVHMLGPHGNLKPENVFVVGDDIKVCDPYLLLGRSDVPAEHGSFPYRDHYVAPELLRDPRDERPACDIYSLGLVVGELIVGTPVRPGLPLSEQGPLFSDALDRFFLSATAQEPGERPPTVAAFWEALRPAIGADDIELQDRVVAGVLRRPAKETLQDLPAMSGFPEESIGDEPAPDVLGILDEPEPEPEIATVSEEPDVFETPDESEPETLPASEDFDAPEVSDEPEFINFPDEPATIFDEFEELREEAFSTIVEQDDEPAPVDEEEDGGTLLPVPPPLPPSEAFVGEAEGDAAPEPDLEMPEEEPAGEQADPLAAFMAAVGDAEPTRGEAERSGLIVFDDGSEEASPQASPVLVPVGKPGDPWAGLPEPGEEKKRRGAAIWFVLLLLLCSLLVGGYFLWPYVRSVGESGLQGAGAPQSASSQLSDTAMTSDTVMGATTAVDIVAVDDAVPGAGRDSDEVSDLVAATVADATPDSVAKSDTVASTDTTATATTDVVPTSDTAVSPDAATVSDAAAVSGAAVVPDVVEVDVFEPTIKFSQLRCPGGMARVGTRISESQWKPGEVAQGGRWAYCIDRYEFPGKGAIPRTGVSWFKAKQACEARGKRLCARSEWRRACGRKYPYGTEFEEGVCNTAMPAGPRPIRPAGSMSDCRSRGVYDMVGNVAEWLANKRVAGGSAKRYGSSASCNRISGRDPGSGDKFVGFRCCADPTIR